VGEKLAASIHSADPARVLASAATADISAPVPAPGHCVVCGIRVLPRGMLVASDARERSKHRGEERIDHMDLHDRITAAIAEHLTVIQQVTAMSSLIQQVASELVATLRRQGKVVLCGNGGSASDAQHMAAEMQGIRAHPDTPQGLLALVLTENTALFTAISNDVGYPAAFRRQVEAMVRSDDLVIGLSTSGRSPNVLEAIRAARQIGVRTVALLGKPRQDFLDEFAELVRLTFRHVSTQVWHGLVVQHQ
jgi:D-sedoheptulose 7-phosphate isomerase